jgi:hypothetical protein
MKLFECQKCGQLLYFENTLCEKCGSRLGYLRARETLSVVEPAGEVWRALAEPERRYRFCANAEYDVCNWLVDQEQPSPYCLACRHNLTVPDLAVPENVTRWRKIEYAKHRLMYSLLKLQLPLATRAEDPIDGLGFEFLVPGAARPDGTVTPVMTGHANGVITISLTEADDAERERTRSEMGEAYRTLLGHFRHEIGHYYQWQLASEEPLVSECRALFGDERVSYSDAIERHYRFGAPDAWPASFISSYATMHPWEDFAECFAHYLHITGTLTTAARSAVTMTADRSRGILSGDIVPRTSYADASMDDILADWRWLSLMFNRINQSMGKGDLYPFTLVAPVAEKLAFIHRLVTGAASNAPDGSPRDAIPARG